MIGPINGIPVGTEFDTYEAMREAGIHRASQAGIVGTEEYGAESVVLNGGYVDDEDHGSWIIYTGYGGRDETTGKQIADQFFQNENSALVTSRSTKRPVRVVRGYKHLSPYSPTLGYRYEGLFRVEDYWRELGKDRFMICRFKLVQIKPDDTGDFLSGGDLAKREEGRTRPRKGRGGSGNVRRLALWACKCGWQGNMQELRATQSGRPTCPKCGADEAGGLGSNS